MKIILWVKGRRGSACLRSLREREEDVRLVVADADEGRSDAASALALARSLGVESVVADDPNDDRLAERIEALEPDLFILAGYGKILHPAMIDLPRQLCINLHAGKLPEYRGSSPLNWALINGDTSFTLSIIEVDPGVDTGPVLLERTFDIASNDTIADLHHTAAEQFPDMVAEVIDGIRAGTVNPWPQDESRSSYYPRRFPDDGLILWDLLTAEQVHNRIRALTEPYPGAFTFFEGRRIKLMASRLPQRDCFGEPGRVYRKTDGRLLVAARDACLWIDAVFADTGEPVSTSIRRYEELATVRRFVQRSHETWGEGCVSKTLTLAGTS